MQKLLVANRGEIAVRILRAARELGLRTVAVYSTADRNAPHTQMADEAFHLGPPEPAESYLAVARLLEAARVCSADAVHPGYGFLSENAAFAEACGQAGLVFVGPSAAAIRDMGSKIVSKRIAERAGVPVIPSFQAPDAAGLAQAAPEAAERLGYPVLVKAAAGGGGKGMRVVEHNSELLPALEGGAREAQQAFGDATLLLEKYIHRPRHVEVQVLGDRSGNRVHLFERECSVQRRHQKIVEETPSTAVDVDLRRRMTEAALRLAGAVDYTSAGTVEFLLAPDGAFYFLEMNTRLQVEHAITELVSGVDLVHQQLRIAGGELLGIHPVGADAAGPRHRMSAVRREPCQRLSARHRLRPRSARAARTGLPHRQRPGAASGDYPLLRPHSREARHPWRNARGGTAAHARPVARLRGSRPDNQPGIPARCDRVGGICRRRHRHGIHRAALPRLAANARPCPRRYWP